MYKNCMRKVIQVGICIYNLYINKNTDINIVIIFFYIIYL